MHIVRSVIQQWQGANKMAMSRVNLIEKFSQWLDGKEDFCFEYTISKNKFEVVYGVDD